MLGLPKVSDIKEWLIPAVPVLSKSHKMPIPVFLFSRDMHNLL